MGGGKGGSTGISPEVQTGLLNNQSALVGIAQAQEAQGQQLFNASFPGFSQAESFYSTLASGNPYAISRAVAPAAQQINQATQGAVSNIQANTPAGGEKNLAIEQTLANQGSQVGAISSQAYLNAPNALASLAGQGVGESQNAAQLGISGLGSANQALSSLGGLQIQGQNLQMQNKGNQLGLFGSLASTAGQLGGTLGSAAKLAPLAL